MSEDMTPSKDEMISRLGEALSAQSLMTETLKETISAQAGIIKHKSELLSRATEDARIYKDRYESAVIFWSKKAKDKSLEDLEKRYRVKSEMEVALEKIADATQMTARGLSEYAGSVLAKARGETPEIGK